MDVAILLYDHVTALDAVGPYEVLSRLPDARMRFVGPEPGPVRCEHGGLGLLVDEPLEALPAPDVLVVPGGRGNRALLTDERLLAWLRDAHARSRWTTSVCTGSLLLAAAGILDGVPAATHWLARDTLAGLGARPVERRVVEHGRVITAAGVSAGIDMGLTLAARIAGEQTAQAIQLGLEYDPQPPFAAGSPDTAPEPVVALLRTLGAEGT